MIACVEDGLKCRYWFELKIDEFFTYLRAYYPEDELRDFFLMILSGDTVFSEYVRLNWERFATVNEMAASLNMTRNRFSKQFSEIFNTPPSRWMTDRRAMKVRDEIFASNELFKQIAFDNGFESEAHFTRFIKKKLGKTPTQLRECADSQEKDASSQAAQSKQPLSSH